MSEQRHRGPARLRTVLEHRHGDLASLRRRARLLDEATRRIGVALPDNLHGHWRVASLSTTALVIAVDSPVWATVVRSHQGMLLDTAADLLDARPARLQTRVITPARAAAPSPAGQSLSPAAADVLKEAARASDNPRLAAALQRLARRSDER